MERAANTMVEREGDDFEDYARVGAVAIPRHNKFRGGVTTHFPSLLHLVLTRAEKDGYSHICGWQSHGRCFTVFNRDAFVAEVMPNYFRQSQYASFQRQLNLYGFRRLSQRSLDHGSYYHEMFLRTREDLCQGILRAKEKDIRALKAARKEPDFLKMKRMPSIPHEDILSTEALLSQQKVGAKEDVHEPYALVEKEGYPLSKLFETVVMKEIDTSDSWMEPRPIAPTLPQHGMTELSTSKKDLAVPKSLISTNDAFAVSSFGRSTANRSLGLPLYSCIEASQLPSLRGDIHQEAFEVRRTQRTM
jgi:hypothetical protein